LEYWSVEIHDSVAMLTFTAPRNPLSLAAMTELADALDDLAVRWDEATVVGLAGGDDGYFIADADRDELVQVAAGEAIEGDPGAWHRATSGAADARLPWPARCG
jgi:enoyl-CoA hydratase/carnithine racemase